MTHDTFISYSKKDKAIADAICKALEDDGLSCWYAPRNVEVGADWDASIMEALANSRVMILVWSLNSDSSKQVKREIAIALDDIGVALIPFRTEIIEPSKLRFYLGNIQWLDASNPPLENNLRLLIDEVRTVIARQETMKTARTVAEERVAEERAAEEGAVEDRRRDEAEAQARVTEAARIKAPAEKQRLEQEKQAAEKERLRREEQRRANERERQRVEAEARPEAKAPDEETHGAFDSQVLPNQRFPLAKVAVAVVSIILLGGLAYAFWPNKQADPDQRAQVASAHDSPTPDAATLFSSPAVSTNSQPSGKPSPAATKAPTPQMANANAASAPAPTPATTPQGTISGGVLNTKATYLAQPVYPEAAKKERASGLVMVQVLIDENGYVSSAQAISGHALLRHAAERAALRSTFSPAKSAGERVKVTGVLTFNFRPPLVFVE
jgi:TonB family protein